MTHHRDGDWKTNNADSGDISVVIPVFNNAEFVEQALQSVFDQNHCRTEIIVVDDGSTDQTSEILAKYSERIKVIRQSNAGSAVARNVGLQEATHDYVAFLDADDWFLPDKLCKQAKILNGNPRIGAVHSGWKTADAEGTITREVQPWINAPRLNLDTWLMRKPVALGAMLFRRHWLQDVGGFDPELRMSQDVDLMLRLSLAGCRFEWQRASTLCYRHHTTSTIHSDGVGQVKYATMVLDKFYANRLVPAPVKRKERLVRYYSYTWLAWHLFNTGNANAVAGQLQRTLPYSRYDFRRTVHDWLYHLTEWTAPQDADFEDLREIIPRLVAIGDEAPSVPPNLADQLDWWLTVWWHYLQQNDAEASRRLHANPTPAPLLDQINFYLRTGISPAHPDAVDRFCQDALAAGQITSTDRYKATELYVTLCGRALYAGDLRIACQSLLRALRYGWHPKAWLPAFRSAQALLGELRTT